MKIATIAVSACRDCPHVSKRVLAWVCTNGALGQPRITKEPGFIPDWCPLPDAEKEEK